MDEVDEEGRDQRPVDDEAGVAFLVPRVRPVVVDAMAVEGERRVAEEQRRARVDGARPLGRLVRTRRALRIARAWRVAIHDVLRFLDDHALRVGDLVAYGDEDERSGAAFLLRDLRDHGAAPDRGAHGQRPHEPQLAAGPHAPRKRGGGKEPPARGVAVDAEARLALARQAVRPMPQLGHRRPGRPVGGLAVEERRHARERAGRDAVLVRLVPTDPGAQSARVHLSVSISPRRRAPRADPPPVPRRCPRRAACRPPRNQARALRRGSRRCPGRGAARGGSGAARRP